MKLKGVLLTTAAALICAVSSGQAQADERLSIYEVNTFVAQLTNAINNPSPTMTRSFLKQKIDSSASFKEANNNYWPNGYHGYVAYDGWNNWNDKNYYRYPYNYGYVHPTSVKTDSKDDFINAIAHKKSVIPRYHQSIAILGTRMPADAKSATLDVNIGEFGYNYALTPYAGYYNGAQLQHANARCNLEIQKRYNEIKITGMNCNRVVNTPVM